MKSNSTIILAAAIATSLAGLPLKAQNMNQNKTPSVDHGTGKAKSTEGTLQEAKDIIGMEVLDSQDHRAGTVRDLVVDLQDGRIAEVILACGVTTDTANSAGNAYSGNSAYQGTYIVPAVEERLSALPPSCLTYNASGKSLTINVAPDLLKNAPTFVMSEWKDAAGGAKMPEVYQHFALTAPTFGSLERGSKLLGEAVINNQDQKLGRVNNLVVNLPSGEVDKVIVASGGFLGIRSQLTALSPQSFSYDPEREKLRVDMTPNLLKSLPHFKAGEWRTFVTSQAEPAAKSPAEALANSDSEGMDEDNE